MTPRRLLLHECAAMPGDTRELVELRAWEDDPAVWTLNVEDYETGDSAYINVTYCPWCCKRLDGEREEGC